MRNQICLRNIYLITTRFRDEYQYLGALAKGSNFADDGLLSSRITQSASNHGKNHGVTYQSN